MSSRDFKDSAMLFVISIVNLNQAKVGYEEKQTHIINKSNNNLFLVYYW
jgi:hypothetical protein